MTSLNGNSSATHYHQSLDIRVALFAYELTDVGHVEFLGHEIGYVAKLKLIEAARDDGVVASFDGNDMVRCVRRTEIFEFLPIECCSLFAQLYA